MTAVDSRVSKGKLSFAIGGGDPVDFDCQPTAVALTPTTDTGDSVEVLCGDTLSSGGTTTYTLDATSIQDFDNPTGLTLWAFAHDGETAVFTWLPNNAGTTPTFSGEVTVQALAIGGTVGQQNTSDMSWPVNGKPVATASETPSASAVAKAPATSGTGGS